MGKRRRKLTRSIRYRPSLRSLKSRVFRINQSSPRLAAEILSWMAQSAIDFLVEDRCVLCGELSQAPPAPAHPSNRFSLELTGKVFQRSIGFLQIENHPICHSCAGDFDETHGSGVIGIRKDSHTARPALDSMDRPPPGGSDSSPYSVPNRSKPHPGDLGIPVISPFMTSDPVLKLVHLMKFSAYTALIPLVSRTIHAAFRRDRARGADASLLIPVPMHPKQMEERGFNHAELIARELSERMGVPLRTGILQRNRSGMRQSMTPREKRLANVEGAFSAPDGSVANAHVLLVDDLVTTGATAAVCSDALKIAGAASLTVLCLGRSL